MTAGTNERADTATDCVKCNSKSQEDKAGTWPPIRKAGKESLQPMPPRGTRRARKRLASFWRIGTPRTSAFSVLLADSSDGSASPDLWHNEATA